MFRRSRTRVAALIPAAALFAAVPAFAAPVTFPYTNDFSTTVADFNEVDDAEWTLNTTTIGGILRNAASAWFTGQIDDVIVWERAVTPAEAQLLATATMMDIFFIPKYQLLCEDATGSSPVENLQKQNPEYHSFPG